MTTLYELLGALPNDGAEDLRTAFRKAAKATHPDTNPDDPDASLRFRELVRAHDILSDAEQRVTYDHLLALAQQPPGSDSRRTTIYQTIHRQASNTLAATVIAGMLIGGYVLFEHVSKAAGLAKNVIEVAASEPAEVAGARPPMAPAEQPEATGRNEPRDRPENVGMPDGMMATSAVAPATNPQVTPNVDPAANPAMTDAKSYRERGMAAYRNGDLNRALADFDKAIQRDPNFGDAYVDRSIVLYRMRELSRAFADIAQAKRIENSSRTRTSAPAPRRASPVKLGDASTISTAIAPGGP
jgi:curved DNA-binding protein CbpA